jgi:hypothetical protein
MHPVRRPAAGRTAGSRTLAPALRTRWAVRRMKLVKERSQKPNLVEFCRRAPSGGQPTVNPRHCTEAEHGRRGLRSSQGQRPPGAATEAARGREQLPRECRCAQRRRPHDAARRYAPGKLE